MTNERERISTIYEWIGGEETIRKLVQTFYPIVKQDPLLSPLFPEDIRPVMEKQFLFLTQYFGGPPLYSEKYGHPMMRARHLPFPITPERARAWLGCMKKAMDAIGLEESHQQLMLTRLTATAFHFVNTPSSEET